MGTYASLVLATMPRRRAVGALNAARKAAATARTIDGISVARAVQAGRFRPDTKPPFTPGRVAFGAGAHQRAYRIDQAEGRHRTEFFVRFRPLQSSGSFDGRDPFAGLLSEVHAPPPVASDA